MPTTQQLRTRLANKLKELFQLDQPDLDFGFYRIMHAKAEQVTTFIENDLLKIVADAFGHLEVQNSQGLLTQAKQRVIDTLGEDAFDAEGNLVAAYRNSPIGKGYLVELAKIEQSKSALSAEADIYDHLYRFFERYYDAGDFISRRYYARETAGKAAPFAVPYNGEEVKLHWANADQYYIKTTEYFANFTFDLRQAKEVNDLRLPLSFGEDEQPRKVHFRIVEATEGEHGNVKAAEATKRFFMIYADNPVERTATGELVINFEYRPDPAKTGAEDTWREKRNAEAVDVVLDKLAALAQADNTMAEYLRLLKISAPTEKDSKRPLLAKYINQYTARNTMDYFIHKDLGSFLRRELDFYIKNEVMRLDDIENAAVSAVETYLAKIKVLRKITGKLIDFLAQLEEFQKKLWLKKKFVVETNYCITLDRVPEELYSEIVANQAQHDEWVRLFAIEDIQGSTITPGYSRQLTIDFLKANNKLLVDTRFFDNAFKTKLVAVAENFDNQISGLLIHSENFQALNFLTEKYRGTFDRVYIDPPYNTDASSIIYKNAYKSSSWLSLIENRLTMASRLMTDEGVLCFAIDDEEVSVARKVLENIFAKEIGVAVVRSNPQSRKAKGTFSPTHEYALFYGNTIDAIPGTLEITEKRLSRYPLQDEKGHYSWMNFIRTGNNDRRVDRPKLYYPIFVDEQDNFRIPQMEWSDDAGEYVLLETPDANEVAVYPVAESGNLIIEKRWHRGHNRVLSEPEEYRVRRDAQGKINIDFKTRIDESSTPVTWWDKNEYASANYGAAELKALFGEKPFDFPKAKKLVEDCIRASGFGSNIIDFFAGSGTSGHAVIDINRVDDESNLNYVLVEMGDYFDTVLKPRIAKVVYSKDWKDGKPTSRDSGISHCFKYLRLESYEDTLNNLRFDDSEAAKQRSATIKKNSALKEDYMLHYLLDVETRGSQSLLNIDAFVDPTAYTLQVKKPGTNEYVEKTVDLLETFNYLIGLRVHHIAAPQTFTADFERLTDPELPHDQHTKLVVKGRICQDADGPWWFRKVEGWVPQDPNNPNNGQQEKVLIVWRKLTGDQEKDNLMLDEWFQRNRISPRDFEFDTIYVNGSNNLPNLKQDGDNWKVRLLEEEFMQRMWDVEGM